MISGAVPPVASCRGWLMLVLFMWLAGCDAPQSGVAVPAASDEPAPSGHEAASIARPAADLRGYYEARDGGLFTQCGETSRRRVVSVADSARSHLEEFAQARFVAARGVLLGRDEVEIGPIEVSGGDAWNCESRFDQFYYAARGTDVPWSLEVTSAAVSFTDSPGAPPLVFPYRTFSTSGNAWRFDLESAGADAFFVELVEQPCSDRMTDSIHALTATIESAGKSYRGCAWRGEREP